MKPYERPKTSRFITYLCIYYCAAVLGSAFAAKPTTVPRKKPAATVSPKAATAEAATTKPLLTSRLATISPPVLTNSVTESAVVSSPASVYQSGYVVLAWEDANAEAVTFKVYYGYSTNSMTNSVSVSSKAVKIDGLPRSVPIYFSVVSVNSSGFESTLSNIIQHTIPNKTTIRIERMAIETYGIFGVTNRIMMSTNMINWTVVKTFIGNGTLVTLLHTNLPSNAFFKTSN